MWFNQTTRVDCLELVEEETVEYRFFDYKYNIVGYEGQHYGSVYQTIYLIVAVALALGLAILLRNVKKEKVRRAVGWIGVGIIALYLFKTLWESHYDVATGRGFNTYLLPFDTCSIYMWAAVIFGFAKEKVAKWAGSWLCTLGFVGGFANMLFLQGLKYYPFFTFGAFYSMVWHAVMVFTAWWLLVSGAVPVEWKIIPRACGTHAVFSVIPLAINFGVSHMNWMLYDTAGGVPFVEGLCEPYKETWKATLIMAAAYLCITVALVIVYRLIALVVDLIRHAAASARDKRSQGLAA